MSISTDDVDVLAVSRLAKLDRALRHAFEHHPTAAGEDGFPYPLGPAARGLVPPSQEP